MCNMLARVTATEATEVPEQQVHLQTMPSKAQAAGSTDSGHS